jgi:hypothetical protein
VLDVEKGLVEGPIGGPAKGSNEYCMRESNWLLAGVASHVKHMIKIITSCSTLTVSERAYDFETAATYRVEIEGGGREETHAHKFWGSGSLNRITGSLVANSYLDTGGELQSHTTWKMNCVPVQRKF